MLWKRIFFNNSLCVHVLDWSEIIRYRSHRLVISHLLCIGGSKWWLLIRLEGLRILWVTWSILSLVKFIEYV